MLWSSYSETIYNKKPNLELSNDYKKEFFIKIKSIINLLENIFEIYIDIRYKNNKEYMKLLTSNLTKKVNKGILFN